jgi:hypothetical protein
LHNGAPYHLALIGNEQKREEKIQKIKSAAAFCLFWGTSINLALLGENGNTLHKERRQN